MKLAVEEVIAITLDNVFKVNRRLEIMLDQHPNEQFNSRIEDTSPQNLTIAMPIRKGYPIHLDRGARFYGKVFADGSVYHFQSSLLDKRIYPLPIWIVSLPSDIKKLQQRAFVRVEAMVPVSIQILTNVNEPSTLINAITKDISGGGLRVVSKKPLKLGNRVQMHIELPESGTIETSAEVVRVDKPDEDRSLYWIGLRYLGLSEGLRSKIIKFVFKKQLEYRQKGL